MAVRIHPAIRLFLISLLAFYAASAWLLPRMWRGSNGDLASFAAGAALSPVLAVGIFTESLASIVISLVGLLSATAIISAIAYRREAVRIALPLSLIHISEPTRPY